MPGIRLCQACGLLTQPLFRGGGITAQLLRVSEVAVQLLQTAHCIGQRRPGPFLLRGELLLRDGLPSGQVT